MHHGIRFFVALLLLCSVTTCAVPAPPPEPPPLSEPPADTPAFPVATPIAFSAMRARGDPQVTTWLTHHRDTGRFAFADGADLATLPAHAEIAPAADPPAQRAVQATLAAPIFVPYHTVGTYQLDRAATAILPSGHHVAGALWLGGSFHLDGTATHDLLLTVLLDYQQVEFSLGGPASHAYVVRIPRDKVVIYDFALADPVPDGEHTLSFVVNWDPWNIYTTRAVKMVFARAGKMTWGAGPPLLFRQLKVVNMYMRVGAHAQPPAVPRQAVPDVRPLPANPGGSLILSRGTSFSDPIWRRPQALGVDEPGRLHAYVSYQPAPELPDAQHALAVLTVFLDDRQVPIQGHPAFFWDIEAGKQYNIPIDLDLPNDGRVHALHALTSFLPFLPSASFDQSRPDWMLGTNPYTADVVPIVPTRDWIFWLPEIEP